MGIADVTQYLSPRSSVVLTGGYGLTDFLTTPKTNFCPTSVNCYFNSQEAIGQLAYNHQISRHDQVALVYAYQELHFPGSTAGSLNVDLWQVEYGHRISGKLDLLIGGGPEWVHRSQSQEEFLGVVPTGLPCTNTSVLLPCVNVKSSFVTGSGQVSVRYRVSALTNFSVTYLRFISSGSDFLAVPKLIPAGSTLTTFGAATGPCCWTPDTRTIRRSWSDFGCRGRSHQLQLLVFRRSRSPEAGQTLWGFWQLSIQRLCFRFQLHRRSCGGLWFFLWTQCFAARFELDTAADSAGLI